MGGDAYINTVKNLGGDLEDPFKIFPEVQKLYDDRAAELRKIVAERHAAEELGQKRTLRRQNRCTSGSLIRLQRLIGVDLYKSVTSLPAMAQQLVSVSLQSRFLT